MGRIMTSPTVRVETAETEAAAWNARLGARNVSTGTIEEFFAWRAVPANAEAYRRVEKVWTDTGKLADDPAILEALNAAMSRKTCPEDRPENSPSSIRKPPTSAAAKPMSVIRKVLRPTARRSGWRCCRWRCTPRRSTTSI